MVFICSLNQIDPISVGLLPDLNRQKHLIMRVMLLKITLY